MTENEDGIKNPDVSSEEERRRRENIKFQRIALDSVREELKGRLELVKEDPQRGEELGEITMNFLKGLHQAEIISDSDWQIIMNYYEIPFGSRLRHVRRFAKANNLIYTVAEKVLKDIRLKVNYFLSQDENRKKILFKLIEPS